MLLSSLDNQDIIIHIDDIIFTRDDVDENLSKIIIITNSQIS